MYSRLYSLLNSFIGFYSTTSAEYKFLVLILMFTTSLFLCPPKNVSKTDSRDYLYTPIARSTKKVLRTYVEPLLEVICFLSFLFGVGDSQPKKSGSSSSKSKIIETNHEKNGVLWKDQKGKGWMKIIHNQKKVERTK